MQLSKEDREFTAGIVEAGKNLFLSPRRSLWIIAAQLFPFLLPAIRLFAERYPDKPLVGHPLTKPYVCGALLACRIARAAGQPLMSCIHNKTPDSYLSRAMQRFLRCHILSSF